MAMSALTLSGAESGKIVLHDPSLFSFLGTGKITLSWGASDPNTFGTSLPDFRLRLPQTYAYSEILGAGQLSLFQRALPTAVKTVDDHTDKKNSARISG